MLLEGQHGLHVRGAGAAGLGAEPGAGDGIRLGRLPLGHGPAHGQVAVDQVVGRGLVGDQVRAHAARLGPRTSSGSTSAALPSRPMDTGFLALAVQLDQAQGVLQVRGLQVQVASAQAEIDVGLLAFHAQGDGAGQGRGQGLGPAHAAQAGGEDPAPGPAAAVVLAAGLGEGFEGALDDALGADVDPGAGGHLAVHEQALAVQFMEVLPGGPAGHQVGVGDEHPGRVGVGAEHAHRLAGLDQQGLVVLQVPQGFQDGVEAGPVARGPADAAVDHQALGVLRHVRVQVVLDHPVGGLREPALAGLLGAPGGADDPGLVPAQILDSSGGCHGLSFPIGCSFPAWPRACRRRRPGRLPAGPGRRPAAWRSAPAGPH